MYLVRSRTRTSQKLSFKNTRSKTVMIRIKKRRGGGDVLIKTTDKEAGQNGKNNRKNSKHFFL
jgi:hypothetical protein